MKLDYSAIFIAAVNHTLDNEGGYSCDPNDPGGETKYGICKRDHPELDIKNLTRVQAIQIYFRDWWQRYSFAELPGKIGEKTFDLAVNMGPRMAVECLQRALRACNNPVAEDGEIGQMTADAAHTCEMNAGKVSPTPLMAALRSEAAAHYRELFARRPNDEEFIRGWLNRAYE